MLGDAERAYQAVIRIKPNHGASLSNLGEIYYRAGKVGDARSYWDNAIKANGKLIAARNNVASMELEQMRKLPGGEKDAGWKKLERMQFNLSTCSASIPITSRRTRCTAGLHGGLAANKNRLDPRSCCRQANKRNEKYPPLQNAYGFITCTAPRSKRSSTSRPRSPGINSRRRG
jgi:tetratricopeptide (TPR) repeat protein